MNALKKGKCQNCNNPFQIPINECFAQCRYCKQLIIYFCHIQKLQLDSQLSYLKIKCQQCQKIYSLVNCPKCQGTMIIKNFILGLPYKCKCGFQSTLIACNSCIKILSLPPNQNYQQTQINCKNCKNNFKYKLCKVCNAMMFKSVNDKNQQFFCPDRECSQSEVAKIFSSRVSKLCQRTQMDPYNIYQPTSKKPLIEKEKQNQQQQQLCKICMNKKAQMINIKCYHLSVCEKCSKQMMNKCPICQAEGQYKKVFKS